MWTSTNPDLVARIYANPDDRDAYLVYGDWLSEQGDPRGELITLQVKLEDAPDDPALRAREQQLMAANAPIWLGEIATLDPQKDLGVTWRWGFVDAVRLGPATDSYGTSAIDFPATIASLMKLPGLHFARELVIGAFDFDPDFDDYPTSWAPCVAALAEHGVPHALQKLRFDRGGYWDSSSTALGDLSPLYPQLGRLRELTIELGAMHFGAMDLPSLRKLEIITGGLDGENLRAIAQARWPALETLILYMGETDGDHGCGVSFDDLVPILAGENLPHVTHLALANTNLADRIAEALPTSRILPRLKTLDLSSGTLGDDGARAILANAAAFQHLEVLGLAHAFLSSEVRAELERLPGPTVSLADPQDAAAGYRYVAVSE
ncbi:MAG: TIGR02996 domain-containing protein [Myxococcota bacterium]|nr:TIGR02996 domain-containing protein [Myxococcota bacterium]